MCGLAGCVGNESLGLPQMVAALTHRGPDDEGQWSDEHVSLAHRRLSILDLSPNGHQPMVSPTGRFVISYNGEVYNFQTLRKQLESQGNGQPFHSDTDTEVLLHGFETWGLLPTLERCVGMFALAVYDRQDRMVHLVRDRLGIKPLYYGWAGNTLLFGSELSALEAHPTFPRELNRKAVTAFLRYAYVPTPLCIYEHAAKLPPGTVAHVSVESPRDVRFETFWSCREVVERAQSDPFLGNDGEAIDALEAALTEAVRLRLVSDVPLGAFLSGGIDSSTVVALMKRVASGPVRTYSIGFDIDAYNEAKDAARVAKHLGTEHTELIVRPEDALAVIPKLPHLYSEPFADSSQIPTYLVSKLARQHVTVALSGDGGDELFAGYNRHLWLPRVWARTSRVPLTVRKATAAVLKRIPPAVWDAGYGPLERHLPRGARFRIPSQKLDKLLGVLPLESPEAIYRHLASMWKDPGSVVIAGSEDENQAPMPAGLSLTEQTMFRDLTTYLPDDILTKVDRASMGVGLEARVPLLDHRVVELAWRLPMSMKQRAGETKWILRRVLERHVPCSLFERPKAGFGIPVGEWLRGPLREWAEELLAEDRLRREGLFHPGPIREAWASHLSGRRNRESELWTILMFQAWSESPR